jgi:DNA mismatch endonuclease (patch repair protein)
MAAVHSRGNTSTEVPLGKLLWAAGIRGYRKHWPIIGKPDFAWPGRRVAVFAGFWHGCNCKSLPRTNTSYWRTKIEANKRRDRSVTASLRRQGWIVLRVRECAVYKPLTLARISRSLEN